MTDIGTISAVSESPERITYIVIPDGPLAVLRPYYSDLISNLDSAKQTLQTALVEGQFGTPVEDAKRIVYSPFPLRIMQSRGKLVLKEGRTPAQHLTVDYSREVLETHLTDEAKKRVGEEWWRSLGTMGLADIPANVEKAKQAIISECLRLGRMIAMDNPANFGFCISSMRNDPALPESLPLRGKQREAQVDLPRLVDRIRLRLVTGYDFSTCRQHMGYYLVFREGTILQSENGVLSFVALTTPGQTDGFMFLAMKDYVASMNTAMSRLLGLQGDFKFIPDEYAC